MLCRRNIRFGCWRCLAKIGFFDGYCPESCRGEADQGQTGAVKLLGKCCIQLLLLLTRDTFKIIILMCSFFVCDTRIGTYSSEREASDDIH